MEERLDFGEANALMRSPNPSTSRCSRRRGNCDIPQCVAPPPLAPLILPVLDSVPDKCQPKNQECIALECADDQCVCVEEQRRTCTKESGSGRKTGISEEEQEEVTLDSDNLIKATGRQLHETPPIVKPPPSRRTVVYGRDVESVTEMKEGMEGDSKEEQTEKKHVNVSKLEKMEHGSTVEETDRKHADDPKLEKIEEKEEVVNVTSKGTVKKEEKSLSDSDQLDAPIPEVFLSGP